MIVNQHFAGQFINRDRELKYLNSRYESGRPEFIIIYGRRRIGKTRLITEFLNGKTGIYFLSLDYSESENIRLLQRQMGDLLGDDSFTKMRIAGFEELFSEFFRWRQEEGRVVFVIDEFPYLIKLNRGISSLFQRIWDLFLSGQNVMLLLSGSAIGMMETEVLGYGSPLYGRRSGQWRLDKLDFEHLRVFFPEYSVDDLVRVYGCTDSIPEYLLKFSPDIDFWENLRMNFLSKGSFLYEDANILLREEFREPRNYMFILKTIAEGNRKLSDIANVTKIDKGALSRYLHNLMRVGIIDAELPAPPTGTKKSKRLLYKIKDNYFKFYFRFVLPNKNNIEAEIDITPKIRRDYNQYLGFVFEELIRDLIRQGKLDIGFLPDDCGAWWYRGDEIGIAATVSDADGSGQIFLGEVKWSDLTERDAARLLNDLQRKSDLVRWHNDTRREHYGIFARRIEGKDALRRDCVYAFDLRDVDPVLKMR